MKQEKLNDKDNNTKKNRIVKSVVGLLIAIAILIILFIIEKSSLTGKTLGFIFYFFVVAISLFEFSRVFPFPFWVKFYFPLLTIVSFFFPWHSLIDWFQDENYTYSLNELIATQYKYLMFDVPAFGYVVQAILSFIPFLFMHKDWKTKLKYFLLMYVIVIILTITGKSLLFLNTRNIYFMLVLFLGPVLCDTFAYFGGMLFGNKIFKKKLAPKISPNKTIEGAICGYFVTWLILFIILYFYNFNNINIDKVVLFSVIPITLPIVAILGDLLFSKIKRIFNVKDYSNLIPGHGGILDRIDSIALTAFIFLMLFLVA